jgi:hypothetical protein
MTAVALVCAGLLAHPSNLTSRRPVTHLEAYEKASAGVGRDARAQVDLALWCESHGLAAQRAKHLALAVLIDPKNAAARGLLGMVSYRDRWQSPAALADRIAADERLSARLAEYNSRRAALLGRSRGRLESARSHVRLGLWCEQVGLKAEATAHFTSAVVLDPYRGAAWSRLGYIQHNGRWVSREQLARGRREAAAQVRADRYYEPLLRRWRGWLTDQDKVAEARQSLAEIHDPLVADTVVRIFGAGDQTDRALAVQLLGQVDSAASTRELASIAAFATSTAERATAITILKSREPRDFAGLLVDLIAEPMRYRVEPVRGPGAPGALAIETSHWRILRTYDAPPPVQLHTSFFGYVGYDPNGLPVAVRGHELRHMAANPQMAPDILRQVEERTAGLIAEAQIKAAASQERLIADVMDIERANARTSDANGRIAAVLTETLQSPSFGDDPDAWHRWWYDRLGYRYERAPESPSILVLNASPQQAPPHIYSCFVAGTPVRTVAGHRAIETLLAGDLVLSQDVTTGRVTVQPVLVVHHNKPGETLKIETDNGETLVASVYHRFWRKGKGWAMARELHAGDVLRTLGGVAKVVAVTSGPIEPLFNLDVAGGRTFFVGRHDALVHDNTLPEPRIQPFDAPGPAVAP